VTPDFDVPECDLESWGRTWRFLPARLFTPRSTEEVAQVVAAAAEAGARLRPIGSLHSWSGLCAGDPETWVCSLERMNRLIEVDRPSMRVRVQAGIRLEDLNDALNHHGLALEVLGSIGAQTLAGATSTNTHGTGRDFGALATMIEAMSLVTADAVTHELSSDRNADLFDAARQGLGALGIVTEVTLRVVPAFLLEEKNAVLPFDEAMDFIERELANNAHFKLYYWPYVPNVKFFRFNRTRGAIRERTGLVRWFHDRLLFWYVLGALLRLGARFPTQVPRINRFAAWVSFRRERFVERSDRIFTIPMPARHDESEYAIPAARAVEALKALRALIEGRRLPVNFVVEVRFSAADGHLMSPGNGRDSCWIGAYAAGEDITQVYYPEFWALMRSFSGRPHLGKTHGLTPGEVFDVFPGARRFDALRKRLDPKGLFENEHLRRLFGG
jgi:FAD/FMN-containing dehydrogenase